MYFQFYLVSLKNIDLDTRSLDFKGQKNKTKQQTNKTPPNSHCQNPIKQFQRQNTSKPRSLIVRNKKETVSMWFKHSKKSSGNLPRKWEKALDACTKQPIKYH